MRIDCPFCGSRDLREFTYQADAETAGPARATLAAEAERVYLRDNPAGPHRGLWYHDAGCRSWLVITRDTRTHAILDVALAGRP